MAEVVVVESESAGGALVASAIHRMMATQPDLVLGLATGSTPLTTYQALADLLKLRPLDVSRVRGFALDEYVGLPDGHPESYRSVVAREIVEPLGLDPARIHVPNGAVHSIATAGADYERAISEAGGVDVQILGIGRTGHLGFNEPGSSFGSLTRIKTLTEKTRSDNARFFATPDQVPTHCITQGLGTIRRARHLILLAFGERKADAIAAAVEGPMTASQPGSSIQLHPHVTVVVDDEAASKLANLAYYRYAFAHKPPWQGV